MGNRQCVPTLGWLGLAAVVACGTVRVEGAGSWRHFRGHKYRLTPERLSWHDAEKLARKEGGHLVAIGSRAEQEWITKTFGPDEFFWIGLTDEKKEGAWRWTTGEPLRYTNWYPGEPNDQGGEDLAIVNFGSPGQWNDLGPGSPEWGGYHGIIEVSPEGETPEVPPGLVLVETRSEERCVGRLRLSALEVQTSYGVLTVPVSELRQVVFGAPGPGTNARPPRPKENESAGATRDGRSPKDRVLTARFTAVGRVPMKQLELESKFGLLVIPRDDILRLVVGGPEPKAKLPRSDE